MSENTPRCSYNRHCGETETLVETAEGLLMCPDHKAQHEKEQREGDREFEEEHPFMRLARAL
jgi:hypothetical protein